MNSREINTYIANTKIAMKYWATVPDENVVAGLETYFIDGFDETPFSCNTIACFGGWVPAMPEFAAMGVTASDSHGVPIFGRSMGSEVAVELFNEETLFAPTKNSGNFSHNCNYDRTAKRDISDHGLVTHRLKEHIKHLKSIS